MEYHEQTVEWNLRNFLTNLTVSLTVATLNWFQYCWCF